jgi:DNA polymerase-3 subunit alpha
MPIESVVEEAGKHNIRTLALTDINNSMGMMDFISACRQSGIKPIAGAEFRDAHNQLLFVALAQNHKGFCEINECITQHNMEKSPLPSRAPGFANVYVIYPLQPQPTFQLAKHEFVGVRPNDINKLAGAHFRSQKQHLTALLPVTFASESEHEIHRYLRAIDNNTLLSKLTTSDMASSRERFVSPDFVRILYSEYPDLLKNAERMAEECVINIDLGSSKNKRTFTGSRCDDRLLLEKLALEGVAYRYGKSNAEAYKRVHHELEIIDQLGFSAYFLITWDIIRYSMSRGFYHVGRGSGANSIVAYCLKITDVDPIELNLYFERFINPKRSSPPDFDIDYSWKDRNEVQDYIFKRYGQKHTALLGTITTFRDRSIFRELGKVIGLPKDEIDRIVEHPGDPSHQDETTSGLFRIGNQIMDFPNTRSIHAGGVLISEEPITHFTALDLPPKGFPTTQFDMYVAEAIGFEKLDILSQRGIGHINECVDIIRQNRGIKVDVHQVKAFKNDVQINNRLYKGEAIGCFYIESPAMRGLLKKLRCNNYLTLVAASSIIRPGVAKSGMMKEYIRRFHNPDVIQYLHPVMEEHLKETFGVMVYQEDVIKVCHHFAGIDLADADILRRAMAGKYRSKGEFDRIQQRFFNNCLEKGHPIELTAEVWRQVASFAGYAFSKAHSASYAVESYQSLYLKTYYPKEFMVAVINNFGGFYRTWVYFNEARRSGAEINLPCVNMSQHKTCIYGSDIYIGFIHISNLESSLIHTLVEEREKKGPFQSLEDFINRVPSGIEQLVSLIRLNAFRFTGKTKKQLLWDAYMMMGKTSSRDLPTLFHHKCRDFQMPQLEQSPLEDAYDEIELLGFPVTLTSFDMLQTSFRGTIKAPDLMEHLGQKVRILGNLVTIKYVHTVKKEWMHFGCFLDTCGEFFDTVNFPSSLAKYPFRGYGIYLILGVVTEEFGFPSITVEKMAKLPFLKDPRY